MLFLCQSMYIVAAVYVVLIRRLGDAEIMVPTLTVVTNKSVAEELLCSLLFADEKSRVLLNAKNNASGSTYINASTIVSC